MINKKINNKIIIDNNNNNNNNIKYKNYNNDFRCLNREVGGE